MRISETQPKSGYFWLPGHRDRTLPGTLTLKDGGRIELEVLGFLDGRSPFGDELHIPRIVGLVEQDGYVTLEECFCINWTMSFGGVSKAHFIAHRALLGISYDENEPVFLDEFRFSVEGLDEWLGMSGIQATADFAKKTATINYVPQDEVVLRLQNGFQLTFGLSWTLPSSPIVTEAKIAQKAHIRLTAPNPTPLDGFTSIAHLITNFLCFASDETVSINSVSGRMTNSTAKDGEKAEKLDMTIVYQSLPFAERPPNTKWHTMLFRFPEIRESAEAMFNAWLNAYEQFQPALDLYFSARTGAHRFLNGRFLALAQAVETLHRRTSSETLFEPVAYEALVATLVGLCPDAHKDWLRSKLAYGNEISLATRLRRVTEPFKNLLGPDDERKRVIRRIADTRNYLTHYDDTLVNRAAQDGPDLYQLCQKLEGILQLSFFAAVGFSDMQVNSIIKANESLRRKLKA